MEDIGNLKNIHSSDWLSSLKVSERCSLSFKIQDWQDETDWLLSLAVRLDYGDIAERYKDFVPDDTKGTGNYKHKVTNQLGHN